MKGRFRRRLAGFALAPAAALVALFPHASIAAEGTHPDDRAICAWAAAKVERVHRIPERLLGAISVAETGRWDRLARRRFAWPWAVGSPAGGGYFATKKEAIAEVRRLQRRGVKNIDVGCMQINLEYHPDAFATLDQAFDPMENAEYAGHFLRRLHGRTRSWSRSVALYHSGFEQRGRRYWRRVAAIWGAERRRAYREAQDEMRAAYRRHKAERAARLGFGGPISSIGAPLVRRP